MFFIAMISVIIYVIAIIAIYHNIYNLDKLNKIKFLIIGCIIMVAITVLLVSISSANIEMPNKEFKSYAEYLDITKTTCILLFAPINSIMLLPYIGNVFNKYTEDRITGEQVRKRFLIILIIFIVIAIFEISYIKDFQVGLLSRVWNKMEEIWNQRLL